MDNVSVLVIVLLDELSSSYGPVTTICTIDGDRVQWGRGTFDLMQNYVQPAGEQAAARNVGLHLLAHTIHGAKVRAAATTGQHSRIKVELAVTRHALPQCFSPGVYLENPVLDYAVFSGQGEIVEEIILDLRVVTFQKPGFSGALRGAPLNDARTETVSVLLQSQSGPVIQVLGTDAVHSDLGGNPSKLNGQARIVHKPSSRAAATILK